MRPSNQLRSVHLIKALDTVLSKNEASTTWTDTPALNFFWVAPHQIAHGSLVRHLLLPIDSLNLIKCVNVWREATVHAEDLLIYNGS